MKKLFFLLISALWICPVVVAQRFGGELRLAIKAEPKTLDPLQMSQESEYVYRYLTTGVLIRMNRMSQQFEPELAESWKAAPDGRRIEFRLRRNVQFSDGTSFDAQDVRYTLEKLLHSATVSPVADIFRASAGKAQVQVVGAHRVAVIFPQPVAALERLFDEIPIVSSQSKSSEASLGPFRLAQRQPGVFLLLGRNPLYWKLDRSGRRLPYLDAIKLEVVTNREIELARFHRGELHIISPLDAELFDRIKADSPGLVHDAGPSLDFEQLWFNQVVSSPLPNFKKAWFKSANFRRGISAAIQREDLCRVVFRGYARAAIGPISPSNRFWWNDSLKQQGAGPTGALSWMSRDEFRIVDGALVDRGGHRVEFSLITNAGNKAREREAAMLQQDLAKIGIRLNIVTLDFPSLIERITRTYDYEACLLGLVNLEVDPISQMNTWLSSSATHAWNPSQKKPETPWEGEIDRQLRVHTSTPNAKARKAAFDEIQRIVWEEAPVLYLVYKNVLAAVDPTVGNAHPVILFPQVLWNADMLYLNSPALRSSQ